MTAEIESQVQSRIIEPILDKMVERGAPFQGILYAGLMLTPDGPKVVEFNVRFGDPEAQVILPRMDTDLAELFNHATRGRLSDMVMKWKNTFALTVVLASSGYPSAPEKGHEIEGLEHLESNTVVFHAGTACVEDKTVSSGGRVLNVTGLGVTLKEAADRAYRAVEKIHFTGKVFRRDIGWRVLGRSS